MLVLQWPLFQRFWENYSTDSTFYRQKVRAMLYVRELKFPELDNNMTLLTTHGPRQLLTRNPYCAYVNKPC